MKTISNFSAIATALLLVSCNALAEVSGIGQNLTPVGAEAGGNASGEIPAWTGGLARDASPVDGKGFLSDPFNNEKPLFTITAANAEQYKDRLTPGQLAMLKRYPDSYRMPVYPTHRSASFPDDWLAATKANVNSVTLIEGGNGVKNYHKGIPFPAPKSGAEAMWNHITHYVSKVRRQFIQVTPQVNGTYTPVGFDVEAFPFYEMKNPPDNILFYFKHRITFPARLAGDVLLVHETLDQVREPRMAWLYNSGQRRVRRAPQVSYDGPGFASEGLTTSDNFDMYNGALDRYDWKLEGKKEVYIPYNSYKLDDPSLKYADIIKPGHLNPDLTRYELHRVWHVVATLKTGERHIYAKRDIYIDEDTWLVSIADHYDGRGNLWRMAEAHAQYFFHRQLPWYTVESVHDLISGRYLAMGLKNEEPKAWDFSPDLRENAYTPAALRQSGIR